MKRHEVLLFIGVPLIALLLMGAVLAPNQVISLNPGGGTSTNISLIQLDSSYVNVTNDLTVLGNSFMNNFRALGAAITNSLSGYGNNFFSNVYVTEINVTNNINVKGNGNFNGLAVTNFLTIGTIQGEIDPSVSGLTLKQRRSIKIQFPARIDGAGCTYGSTNDFTATNYMQAVFSGTAATNGNWLDFGFRVPNDLASTDLTASLSIQKNGTDTNVFTFTVGMVSIADGAAVAGTPANYNTLTILPVNATAGALASTNNVTLSGWSGAMTANQWCLGRLSRVGGDANNDTGGFKELEIFYTSTQ